MQGEGRGRSVRLRPGTAPAARPPFSARLGGRGSGICLRGSAVPGITLPPADHFLDVAVAAGLEAEILDGFGETGSRCDILGFSPGNFYEALLKKEDLPELHDGPLRNLQCFGRLFHKA